MCIKVNKRHNKGHAFWWLLLNLLLVQKKSWCLLKILLLFRIFWAKRDIFQLEERVCVCLCPKKPLRIIKSISFLFQPSKPVINLCVFLTKRPLPTTFDTIFFKLVRLIFSHSKPLQRYGEHYLHLTITPPVIMSRALQIDITLALLIKI